MSPDSLSLDTAPGIVRFAPWRRRALALLLLCCSGLSPALVRAQAPVPLERQVMAAYLLKFAGFVEWPEKSFAKADSALLIGVVGSDVLAEQLERMVAGRSVGGHPVAVRRLQRGESLAGLHILFIDRSMERHTQADMLAAARNYSLLTVTDADDGLTQGFMISFVLAGERLRFDVGLKQVGPSGLRISARMLAVAHRVQGAS